MTDRTQSPLGVLLVNLGTPNEPDVSNVRRYLREFLMDARVIDIPWLQRLLLVKGLIVPLRARKSSKAYAQLWTSQGSPLRYHTKHLTEKLQAVLGPGFLLRYAMRYQYPSLDEAVDELREVPLSALIVVPLFPQYASATTGSITELLFQKIARWPRVPSLYMLNQFHLRAEFLDAWAERSKPFLDQQWDAILFSYHGLPERQIKKASLRDYCQMDSCCSEPHAANRYCYRAQCLAMTDALVRRLGWPVEKSDTSFQSRLGRSPWLQPYTEDVLKHYAANKKKRVLIYAPSFVSDCLETTVEIEQEYSNLFLSHGGEKLQLVPSLNDSDTWVEALRLWILKASGALL